MIVIFDKLTASIVGAVLFVMIFTLQIRVQSNSVEDTLFYQAKKHTLSFAETLERDLSNAGYRTTPGEDVLLALTNTQHDSTDVTTLFEFWGIAADGSRARIRYTTTATDSVLVAQGMVQAFQVRRFENTGTAWTDAGASAPTLVAFEVAPLDENGLDATFANARKLRVNMSNAVGTNFMAREGAATRVAHQLRWGVTLAPVGLSLQGYQG